MKLRAVETDEQFELERIIERQGGKKIKRPIYIFKYTNRPGREPIRTYKEDVDRALTMGFWIKIKE